MAYDRTPTSNKAIVIAGIAAIVTLVALRFVFDSYFISITEETRHEKLASPEQLIQTRQAERKALAEIDGTIAALARQGRANATGAADITAQQSEDIGPLSGWNKLPRAATPFVAPGGEPPAAAAEAPPAPGAEANPQQTHDDHGHEHGHDHDHGHQH